MSIRSTAAQVKQHVSDHKEAYITGVVCVAITATVMSRTQIINTVAPVFNNNNSPVAIANATANAYGGYATKIVRCLDTNETYDTVKEAAEAAGVIPSTMSRHLNGHRDHIGNKQYAIIGQGTTG